MIIKENGEILPQVGMYWAVYPLRPHDFPRSLGMYKPIHPSVLIQFTSFLVQKGIAKYQLPPFKLPGALSSTHHLSSNLVKSISEKVFWLTFNDAQEIQ